MISFGLHNERHESNFCGSILSAFKTDVSPCRFGVNAQSRQEFIKEYTSRIADGLHNIGDHLTLICDGI